MKLFACTTLSNLQDRLESLYGERRTPGLLQRLTVTAGSCATDEIPEQRCMSCWSEKEIVLVTYGDMIGNDDEPGLVTLKRFLDSQLRGVIDCVHLLPPFPSSSGEGFAVIDYRGIDPALGDWRQVDAISADYRLMLDLVINHCSRQSEWFQDFVNGIAPGRDYFITARADDDLSAVDRVREHPLLTSTATRHGERLVWTTFSADQMDVDFSNPDLLFEFIAILLLYVSHGAKIIRLDAVAFLWKEVGTRCLHLEQTHEVIKLLRGVLELVAPDVLLLADSNAPGDESIGYFGDGDEAQLVSQFSLPPLLLLALYTGNASHLTRWAADLEAPPGCSFLNFTASQDGIGLGPLEELVTDDERGLLIEAVEARGGYVSYRSGAGGESLPYELNISWFDALSDVNQPSDQAPGPLHIARQLCSQTLPLSLQGIPSVYFHGLTATGNDQQRVEASGHPRDINRHRWQEAELYQRLSDPDHHMGMVFQETLRLLRLRAAQPAFHPTASQQVLQLGDALFAVVRRVTDEEQGAKQRLIAISNLSDQPQPLTLPKSETLIDLIAGGSYAHGRLRLAPYQCVWLVRKREQQA